MRQKFTADELYIMDHKAKDAAIYWMQDRLEIFQNRPCPTG